VAEDTNTLILKFQADTELARAELKQLVGTLGSTAAEVDQRLARIEAGFSRANKGISTAAVAIGSALGTIAGNLLAQVPSALIQLTQASVEAAGSIKNTAEQLGITTDQLQDFRLGASKAGVEVNQADAALDKFVQTTGKAASGNRAAVDSFKAIGVEIADANGNLKPFSTLLPEVFDGIAKLPDPARQAAAAIALFGANGDDLLPFLRQGSQGINDLAAASEALGLKLSPETIDRLDKLGNKADEIRKVITVQLASAIGENADAILALGSAAQNAIAGVAGLLRQMQAIKLLVSKGDINTLLFSSAEELEAIATPKGRLDYANKRLADLQGGDRPSLIPGARAERDAAFEAYLASTFPLSGPAGAGAAGGKVTPPKATGGGGRKSAGKAPKAELTPAQQRDLADFTPTAETLAGLLDPGQLQSSLGVLKEIQTIAVDLSNVEIIDPQALEAANRFGENLSRNLAQAIVLGDNLGDALVNAFQAAAAEAIASGLFDLLTGAFSSILGGGGFLSGLFGGARATGGPVGPGKAFLVGERGPELFVPSGNGNIIANKFMGGGGGAVVNNFDLRGAVVTEELYRQMQLIGAQAAQAGAAGGAQMAAQNQARRAQRRLG
jgi:hypothetical protein